MIFEIIGVTLAIVVPSVFIVWYCSRDYVKTKQGR